MVDLLPGRGAEVDVAGDGLFVREHGELLHVCDTVALHRGRALGLARGVGQVHGHRAPEPEEGHDDTRRVRSFSPRAIDELARVVSGSDAAEATVRERNGEDARNVSPGARACRVTRRPIIVKTRRLSPGRLAFVRTAPI